MKLLLVLATSMALAGCQTGGGSPGSQRADVTGDPVPFSSIYVSGLTAEITNRSRSTSPYLSPTTNTNRYPTQRTLTNYADAGFLTGGGLLQGMGSINCYVDGSQSDVVIAYAVGHAKSDRFNCSGNPASDRTEKYRITYSSRASLDGGLLKLSGQMNGNGTSTWFGRTTETKLSYDEEIVIRISAGGCEVVSWRQTEQESEYIPETRTHYSTDDKTTTVVSPANEINCQLIE